MRGYSLCRCASSTIAATPAVRSVLVCCRGYHYIPVYPWYPGTGNTKEMDGSATYAPGRRPEFRETAFSK